MTGSKADAKYEDVRRVDSALEAYTKTRSPRRTVWEAPRLARRRRIVTLLP